jgi:hypothetical protein
MKNIIVTLSLIVLSRFVQNYAHKKGEGVVPAGGETGRPHCLAEVYKAVKTALYFRQIIKERKVNGNSAKRINNRTANKGFISTPHQTSLDSLYNL